MDENVYSSIKNLTGDPSFDFIQQLAINDDNNNNYDFLDIQNNDSPYHNSKIACNYVDTDQLKHSLSNRNGKTVLMSFNIQSINAKFSDFKELILELMEGANHPDVICLQEIWHIADPNYFNLPGYQDIIFRKRNKKQGEGVAIYLKNGIPYKTLESPFLEQVYETLFLEICLNNKKINIGSVYRSNTVPTFMSHIEHMSTFMEGISSSLSLLNTQSHEIIVCGDFNLDVLKCNTNNFVADYINTLYSNGILQIVTKPTRFTGNLATCLDHILVNPSTDSFETLILTTLISDHFPVFYLGSKTGKRNDKVQSEVTLRDFSEQNIQTFKTIYSNINWQSVTTQNDPDIALDQFLDIFSTTFDPTLPLELLNLTKTFTK